jgi:hypothetical protein
MADARLIAEVKHLSERMRFEEERNRPITPQVSTLADLSR